MRRILPLLIISIVANWSNRQSSIDGRKKQKINFYGTLVLRNGNTYSVENISIKYDHQKIIMYEIPPHTHNPTAQSPKNPLQYIALTTNPKDAQREIDLSEIQEIRIPNPDIIYSYKPEAGSEREYIALTIVLNDPPNNTERNVLIEKNEPLRCDEVNPAGPQESKYYFNTLVKIHIDGYRERVLSPALRDSSCEIICDKNKPIQTPSQN